MFRTRRAFLGSVTALALAGCSGNTGSSGETTTTTTTATTTTTTESTTSGSNPTVQVRSHSELGEILVDSAGMTLYMFDQDTKGEKASSCYDSCANAWPPLTVDGEPSKGSSVTASLTTFERKDGAMQVMAGGWPLYYFASDEQPGDAKGQGANDVWWVLRPDGAPVKPSSTTTTTTTTSDSGMDY